MLPAEKTKNADKYDKNFGYLQVNSILSGQEK
jgi:hypothetical protein